MVNSRELLILNDNPRQSIYTEEWFRDHLETSFIYDDLTRYILEISENPLHKQDMSPCVCVILINDDDIPISMYQVGALCREIDTELILFTKSDLIKDSVVLRDTASIVWRADCLLAVIKDSH